MGYSLPSVVPEGKLLKGVLVGDLYFSSGIGSPSFRGKLGTDLTVEQGYEAARECCLHLLANMKAVVGDLDKVAKGSQAAVHGEQRSQLWRAAGSR